MGCRLHSFSFEQWATTRAPGILMLCLFRSIYLCLCRRTGLWMLVLCVVVSSQWTYRAASGRRWPVSVLSLFCCCWWMWHHVCMCPLLVLVLAWARLGWRMRTTGHRSTAPCTHQLH